MGHGGGVQIGGKSTGRAAADEDLGRRPERWLSVHDMLQDRLADEAASEVEGRSIELNRCLWSP